MKKLIISFLLLASFGWSSFANAQSICAQLQITGVPNINQGGWFCNQDTLVINELSYGPVNYWMFIIQDENFNGLDTIEYYSSNYQPQVVFVFPHTNADYRVELQAIHDDPLGSYASIINCGIKISFANILVSSDQYIVPGESLDLTAVNDGGNGSFLWTKNGGQFVFHEAGTDTSIITVSDTGLYTVKYSSFSCIDIKSIQILPVAPFCSVSVDYDTVYTSPGFIISLAASSPDLGTFKWYHNGFNFFVAANSGACAIGVYDTGVYVVEYSHQGCTAYDTVVVLMSPFTTCEVAAYSDTVYMTANTAVIGAYSPETGTFNWYKDGLLFFTASNTTGATLAVYDTGMYTVMYSHLGCEVYTNVCVLPPSITTGMVDSDNNKLSISVYPNPATDNLSIFASQAIEKIEIYSLVGKLVYSAFNAEAKITIIVSDWKPGVYLVHALVNNQETNTKLIIQ